MRTEGRDAEDGVVSPIGALIRLPPGLAGSPAAHRRAHAELEQAGEGGGGGTPDDQLLQDGKPKFGLNFYILNKNGEFAGVSMYESTYAVCTENGPETRRTESLFEGKEPE